MKPKPEPLATIREELADYERQRTYEQGQIDKENQAVMHHQSETQRHQQLAGQANARFLVADGAHQACSALLKKLDVQAPVGVPSKIALEAAPPQ